MTSIVGLCRFGGAEVAPTDLAAMLAPPIAAHGAHESQRGQWTDAGVALAAVSRPRPQRTMQALATTAEPLLAIAGDLRLDNREELGRALGVPAGDLDAWGDARLVLEAYRRWADDCVVRLVGDFAFGLWDAGRQRLLCARDPFGVKPLHYHASAGSFAFATEMQSLLALDTVDRAINEDWVCDFLLGVVIERDTTLFAHVRRLEPAHLLVVDAAGVRSRRYWNVDVSSEVSLSDDDAYVEAFRERLTRAIRRRIPTDGLLGAELSGGLDSSGITAIAHQLLTADGRPLHTFSQVLVPDQPGAYLQEDGLPAIELVRRHVGLTHVHFLDNAQHGAIEALDWTAKWCAQPPHFLLPLWSASTFAAAREQGVATLLSGYGGNQGVTSLGGGWWDELVAQRRWRDLWRELRRSRSLSRLVRSSAGLALRRLAPKPLAHWKAARSAYFQKLPYRPLRDDRFAQHGMKDRIARFLAQYDVSLGVRERIAQSLSDPGVALRLEFSADAMRPRGIEYHYPLLDRELIEFYVATPHYMKQRDGVGRYLFRRAVQGLLPAEVQWSSPRAGAVPNAPHRMQRDSAALKERFDALSPTSRVFDFVDRAKLHVTFDVNMSRGRSRWAREGDIVKVLMLDQSLRRAADR